MVERKSASRGGAELIKTWRTVTKLKEKVPNLTGRGHGERFREERDELPSLMSEWSLVCVLGDGVKLSNELAKE